MFKGIWEVVTAVVRVRKTALDGIEWQELVHIVAALFQSFESNAI